MKILILGANGMLGHELAEAFSDRGKYETILWDRGELDITDKEDVNKKISEMKPDAIINAAAYTAVDQAESEPDLVYNINGYAVGYLASACKDNGALLVHFSTDYVFDGENHMGYKEDYATKNPATVYGKSKKLAEKLIEDIGPRHYLIRTQWLFGKSGKNFVETMIRLASEGKDLKVVNDQFGSPTYAKDLACRVRDMIEENRESGVYHVTNSNTCNWYDFALKIFEMTGFNPNVQAVKTEEFAAAAKRPTYSMLINTKLPPLRSYEEALRAYLIETGRIKE
ncbi:MAG: dTDP-4-dehydrorhamnose reductase [Candidatus Pacebacteria bacterium]|nr:dTDP-4-dehydrorhamnose reductase [Candidatus Paceibacterota bacterium]